MADRPDYPQPGESFEGRYTIGEALARGGLSRVFVATQDQLERRVAIKVMVPPDDPSEESGSDDHTRWRVRFDREAKLVSKLASPHAITIHDYGETDDELAYMVFEYVDGRTVKEELERDGPFSEERTIELLEQALDALGEAHQRGVLHRDIKPANLMLTRRGDSEHLTVLDFGIAREFEIDEQVGGAALTQEGRVVGTPKYIAPECIFRGDIGPPADIYSLGLVAWEMLTAEPVVDVSGTESALRAHADSTAFDLTPPNGETTDLVRLIHRMVEKAPEDRPQNVEEVRHALESARMNEPTDIAETIETSALDGSNSSPFGSSDDVIDPNVGGPAADLADSSSPISRLDEPPSRASSDSGDTSASSGSAPASDSPDGPAAASAASSEANRQPESIPARIRESTPEPLDIDGSGDSTTGPDVDALLARGERRESLKHKLTWVAVAVALLILGALVYLTGFASPELRGKLGVQSGVQELERLTVDPVRDSLWPEHHEVPTEGIFTVISGTGWEPVGPPSEIQIPNESRHIRLFRRKHATVEVTVFECTDRAAARVRQDEYEPPTRTVRFARRLAAIKPIDDVDSEELDTLVLMLEKYRDLSDEKR